MTKFNVSRRKVLAGLGTIGIASAGAGLGTTAFFSDEESLEGSLEAGRVDLLVDYRATYNPWMTATEAAERGLLGEGTSARDIPGSDSILVGERPALSRGEDFTYGDVGAAAGDAGDALSNEEWTDFTNAYDVCVNPEDLDYVDGPEEMTFSLVDIKPKDEGEVTFSLHVCDNRSYLWLSAATSNDTDNTVYEPEGVDTDAEGELDDFLFVRVWLDTDCSNTLDAEEQVLYQGSLAGLVDTIESVDDERGLMLETAEGEKCFVGLHCLAFYWYLPCYPVQEDDGMGFTQLPSDVVGVEGSLADEIVAKYDRFETADDIDVNVVQTDTVDFGFTFHVEQCRHNMMDGPAFRHVVGEGFGKNDAGANGLVEPVALEGKIRKGQSPNKGTFAYTLQNNVTNVSDPLNGTNVPNGTAQSFTLSYDGTTANLTVDDADDTVDIDIASDITDAVGVTVRGRGSVSKAVVENLRLEVPSSGIDTTVPTLDPFDNASYPSDDQPERYCAFLDVDGLDEGFTLTGDATLTWDGDSSQEQPAVYFFAGATGA